MKIVGVQCDIKIGEIDQNLSLFEERMNLAKAREADLVIFPECALTGYCFESREEASEFAQPANGPAAQRIAKACATHNLFCIYGFLESDGDAIYNAASLIGPAGVVGTYRKVHLPFLGIDRFTDPGSDTQTVLESDSARVGINICYDAGFPEASRCLALGGADLIALPTNWPPGAECMTPNAVSTRAMENKVYFAAINRIGTERGVTFIGRSCICGPNGETLAMATSNGDELLEAVVDVSKTRNKHIIRREGTHEIDRFADRRPECYGALVESHDLVTPRMRLTQE